MGKGNRVDTLTTCLIGLAVGALMLCGPRAARAEEDAADTAPAVAEEASGTDTSEDVQNDEEAESPAAEESDTADGTPESDQAGSEEAAAAEEESAAAGENSADTPQDSAEPGNAADETAAAPAEAAADRDAAEAQDPPAGMDGAEPAPAADTPESDTGDFPAPADGLPVPTAGEAGAGEVPAEGAQTDGGIPANETSGATQVRARDPITGTSDPFEYEPGPLDEDEEEFSARDPLEGMNRAFFQFNDFLDKLLLKPTAEIYRLILPTYVQDRIRNVVNNADSPVILANDILQWKWDRAWTTTSRFFINTTLGVGGIWDVATSFGIERHEEDFGQTLCVWGVGEWLYLYLPFVGPTNPRDITGKVVDRFFDPLSYYADVVQQVNFSGGGQIKFNIDRAGMAQLALTAADLIDMRARNIETINEIERTSIDFYTAVRSLYRQSRDSACKDGKVDFEDLPDLSDEFE